MTQPGYALIDRKRIGAMRDIELYRAILGLTPTLDGGQQC